MVAGGGNPIIAITAAAWAGSRRDVNTVWPRSGFSAWVGFPGDFCRGFPAEVGFGLILRFAAAGGGWPLAKGHLTSTPHIYPSHLPHTSSFDNLRMNAGQQAQDECGAAHPHSPHPHITPHAHVHTTQAAGLDPGIVPLCSPYSAPSGGMGFWHWGYYRT